MQKDRANHPGFGVVARLRPGVDRRRGAARDVDIAAALEREYPASNSEIRRAGEADDRGRRRRYPADAAPADGGGRRAAPDCLRQRREPAARPGLRRERETSIRSALGASRFRLVRLFLIEGLALGARRRAAGLLLAGWGVRLLRGVPGLALPRARRRGDRSARAGLRGGARRRDGGAVRPGAGRAAVARRSDAGPAAEGTGDGAGARARGSAPRSSPSRSRCSSCCSRARR